MWRGQGEGAIKRPNIEKSRELRRNQTETEKKLWSILRNRQLSDVKFRRQFSIGRYILDFYSPEYKVGIEADGGQHYDENGKERDDARANDLAKKGIEILRFNNIDILTNIEGVCETIRHKIEEKKQIPSP